VALFPAHVTVEEPTNRQEQRTRSQHDDTDHDDNASGRQKA